MICLFGAHVIQPRLRCCGVLEESLLALDQAFLLPTLWREYTFGLTLIQLLPSPWRQDPSCGFR
ncbi:hypothetical protein OAE83_00905 [bacterium]|nr:hypothetical protein [bacterium]